MRELAKESAESTAVVSAVRDLFLPVGYPQSVSSDYLTYQVYDSLQAVCSSVTGAFATRAVLGGIGVGDANANAVSATTNWLLRDGAAMIGRIAFGAKFASALDSEAKRWRLVADILNDCAIALDVCTMYLPSHWFLACVCVSSVLRAVVGVAGSCTKTAVAVHQARADNIGDVLAKDASQETLNNVFGWLLSMYLLPRCDDARAAVAVGIVLHLYCNYCAVRAIAFNTFNRQRLALAFDAFRENGAVPSPENVALHERLFVSTANPLQSIVIGESAVAVMRKSVPRLSESLSSLAARKFALFYHSNNTWVFLRDDADATSQLEALCETSSIDWRAFRQRAEQSGWNVHSVSLDAKSWRIEQLSCTTRK